MKPQPYLFPLSSLQVFKSSRGQYQCHDFLYRSLISHRPLCLGLEVWGGAYLIATTGPAYSHIAASVKHNIVAVLLLLSHSFGRPGPFEQLPRCITHTVISGTMELTIRLLILQPHSSGSLPATFHIRSLRGQGDSRAWTGLAVCIIALLTNTDDR